MCKVPIVVMLSASVAKGLIKAVQIPLSILSLLQQGISPDHVKLRNNAEYDYIIVGGGTAGLVVAKRLSENQKYSVIVLEAGPKAPIEALLSGVYVLMPESHVDFNYTSTYDPYAARSQNNYSKLTVGKMLGGSASMNHLFAMRGPKQDFDTWDKIVNPDNKGNSWSYDAVLPYFIKLENVQDDEIMKTYPSYHGDRGPIMLTREPDKKATKYLEAFAEVGNPTVVDLNAEISAGYTQPLYTIGKFFRQTPAHSYKPFNKQNLHISTKTYVTKVLMQNGTAYGVEADSKSTTYTIKARKEVILCAGVFNSPLLLMLSGIGNRTHLESFNIPVQIDLPAVGENLQDQVAVSVVHTMEKSIIPNLAPPPPTRNAFPVVLGAVPLNKTSNVPDYQTFGLIIPNDTPFLILTCSVVFGYRDEICNGLKSKVKFKNIFYGLLAHGHPKSRGTVRLASDDPFQKPLITMNYYKEDSDLEDMVDYILDFLQVQKSTYFKKAGAKLIGLDLPECSSHSQERRKFWRCYILNMSVSPYHYTSTCAMGSVVDSELKVYKTSNLRVVDASVMPTLPRHAPHMAVLMIAEKAADMISKKN